MTSDLLNIRKETQLSLLEKLTLEASFFCSVFESTVHSSRDILTSDQVYYEES